MPRLILPVLSALLFVMLVGAAGIALGVTWFPGWTGIDAEADALPAQDKLTARAARRCPHCGTIESKREVPPSAAAPGALQTYEYSLRMADGSSSVFQEALPASWRLGERVMVIDGTAGSRKN